MRVVWIELWPFGHLAYCTAVARRGEFQPGLREHSTPYMGYLSVRPPLQSISGTPQAPYGLRLLEGLATYLSDLPKGQG